MEIDGDRRAVILELVLAIRLRTPMQLQSQIGGLAGSSNCWIWSARSASVAGYRNFL